MRTSRQEMKTEMTQTPRRKSRNAETSPTYEGDNDNDDNEEEIINETTDEQKVSQVELTRHIGKSVLLNFKEEESW